MIPYLKLFFEEKDLPEVLWELTSKDGEIHSISNTVVIEHLAITSKEEQRAVANVIRKIDHANGDVNDYLKHLATAIINKLTNEERT